jgi:hypothetical protein
MPLVVLDPVVLVNTGKVPDGPSAKLLTLLAYGRAIGYLNAGANAESHWLQQWPPDTAVDVSHRSPETDGTAYAYTFGARNALARGIPVHGRSTDLCLALSTKLIDRVVRRIDRLREAEDLDLDAGIVAAAVSIHAARWSADDWDFTPDYTETGDMDCNVSIHTALRTGAALVVTKLPDACDPETPRMYYPIDPDQDYPLGATHAMHFDLLIDALCQEFDFHAINARVLEQIAPTGPLSGLSPRAMPPPEATARR